ncbi:MAG: DNA-directed RNA polymerase subunit omega [Candidatus Kaelpia imicola]|nr:DNA-directed RNA polymerase subunit omega [Candidatus Kaelpia imicola]
MSYVKLDDVRRNIESIYKATIIAAQRAVEVSEAMANQKLVTKQKPTTFAIHELQEGKLKYKKVG